MVFSGIEFLYYFLPAVMLIYFLAPKRLKNLMLFVSGLGFYAWGEPVYVIVMVISTAVDYTAGILMSKTEDERKRRACLISSVVINLGLLFTFKYSSFAVDTFNGIFRTAIPSPNLPLPIGISFFTFQSMSYTIDLYRRKITVQRSFINFAAYVTCFPQIVAGPIVKYQDIAAELDDRRVSISDMSDGVSVFIVGLAKKVLLANNIGIFWSRVKEMDYSTLPALTAWLGIIAFTFQIYFDFSGYSDMAIGLGRMLGFTYPKNFDLPYLSKSVSQFWRRWHITLGSWFRDYVYIPLGGSRAGKWKTVRNLAIVWLLTGLWHGASMNFVLWGAWFGLLIIAEHMGMARLLERLPAVFSWLYTMLAVVLGWVLFDTDSISSALRFIGAMFGAGGSFATGASWSLIGQAAISLALCIFFSSGATKNYIKRIGGQDSKVILVLKPVITAALLIASTAYLVNSTYNPFLYFNF
jgi:alginate O-acetyltransferase complex protein AlgI